MQLPENSISSWADLCHEFIGACTGVIKNPAGPVNCSFSNRRKEKPSISIYRDSAKFIEIFQMSIQQP